MNKILLALLAGVAIGVLVAPDKGSETLKKLRKSLDDLTDQAKDHADDLADRAKSAFDKGRDKAGEAFE